MEEKLKKKMNNIILMETNVIYYGDNLEILRKYIPEESIDLIYLDPPWKSNKPYNILFKAPSGKLSEAQIIAFDDTWHWGKEAELTFEEIVEKASPNVVSMMSAFKSFLGTNDVMAYLTMICPRLIEMHRILKDTGTIFFHCNPVIGHYVKILLDAIFGKEQFRNEIVWCYTGREHPTTKVFPWRHQTIFFYSKGEKYRKKFHPLFREYDKGYVDLYFDQKDEDGRKFQWQSGGKGGRYKQYLDESPGIRIPDWWEQKREGIKPLHGKDMYTMHKKDEEEYYYPTQKPVRLLEMIMESASDEGDLVLDPFCGCGTALIAAQRLKREWIGIDVTYLAVDVMKYRLKKAFPDISFKIKGEPVGFYGAKKLSEQNKHQFAIWIVSRIGGHPSDKKSWDRGIDGYYFFMDGKDVKKAMIQVKSGKVNPSNIRDFCHVVEREADMGLFITLNPPSAEMKKEALTKGFYVDSVKNKYQRVQILTIEEILKGKEPDIPQKIPVYKFRTKGKKEKKIEQKKLL